MPKSYWSKHHLPEPPVNQGFWEYGTVWVPGQLPPEIERSRRDLARLVWWSYKTWAVKVYKECRGIHYGKTKDAPIT